MDEKGVETCVNRVVERIVLGEKGEETCVNRVVERKDAQHKIDSNVRKTSEKIVTHNGAEVTQQQEETEKVETYKKERVESQKKMIVLSMSVNQV